MPSTNNFNSFGDYYFESAFLFIVLYAGLHFDVNTHQYSLI